MKTIDKLIQIGERKGHLVVIEIFKRKDKHIYYKCKCDCGNFRNIRRDYFLSHNVTTCGKSNKCIYAYENRTKKLRKGNRYDLSGEYGIGYSNKNNKEFYFDKEDFEKIRKYTWYFDKFGYVRTNTYDFENQKRGYMFLHNYIMNLPNNKSIIADHIGGINTINDNRKCNLRIASVSQNNINQRLRKDNSSGVKGVNYDSNKNKWIARIQIDGKRINLGNFNSLEDAVNARIKAEQRYYGEFEYNQSQEIRRNNNETLYGYCSG